MPLHSIPTPREAKPLFHSGNFESSPGFFLGEALTGPTTTILVFEGKPVLGIPSGSSKAFLRHTVYEHSLAIFFRVKLSSAAREHSRKKAFEVRQQLPSPCEPSTAEPPSLPVPGYLGSLSTPAFVLDSSSSTTTTSSTKQKTGQQYAGFPGTD
eukprot:2250731-Rhodomonas_salina.1